jgi:hypothetical protein
MISSTIVVSIIRLWALSHYATSSNPIYDNMLSGIFSPLELNVGIICMCMPAFRRFVARFAPTCFGSTFASSNRKYYEDEHEHDTVRRSGTKRSKGKRDTLGGSLFQSTIVKTVDTQVGEEGGDQVRLVELGGSMGEMAGKRGVPEGVYREGNGGVSPREW